MTILFWIERSRVDRKGHAPIKMRLQHKKERINIGLDIKIPPQNWDNVKQRIKGKNENADKLNALLQTHHNRVIDAHTRLLREKESFTLREIADLYKGEHVKDIGFLKMFDAHINNLRARVGVDYCKATVNKYEYSRNNLEKYIHTKYKRNDYPVRAVNRQFVMELDQFLRGEMRFLNNHVNKTIEHIRKIYKLCVTYNYADGNPFDVIRFTTTPTYKEFLSMEELTRLIHHHPSTPRMQETRDIFLFLCCTGLSHTDACKASYHQIKTGIDERPWLEIRRTKTDTLTLVPLLPLVVEIIQKYMHHPKCCRNSLLLPIPTNQVLNRAIKLLLREIGINKHCSSHSGRYTFASTILLANGIRMEVAQRFLAHKSIRSTTCYAKLTEHTLVTEIKDLLVKVPMLA